ncbi:MAG: CDF family Co(II)/Ni(II) efflux transporter DmeF [Proteobacteria bacterium]|nr:CDF family Co(II)/Ni(II) efflux transporter DmeF [Pseudomonadota bacterium]
MRGTELDPFSHSHTFGTDQPVAGERRTRWVVVLTVAMMVLEIVAGLRFGSMALLADGWHMGTHAAALGVALFAYVYARRHAEDTRYSFGTGKVGALGGFGSAVGLAVVALLVVVESLWRLAAPVGIHFNEALVVAAVGLMVNVLSALLLGDNGHPSPSESASRGGAVEHHDHNLRGAYLHVVADALTSALAIVALLAGKTLGWGWLDPAIGALSGLVIARWSYGLLRDTAAVLLDAELPQARRDALRALIEAEADNRVADLHVWRVGPRHLALIASVVTAQPRPPAHYKALLADQPDLCHVTIEVCSDPERDLAAGGRAAPATQQKGTQ